MNILQKAGVAVFAVAGMSFAGGSLWGADVQDFPSLQVRVPDVMDCLENSEEALACWEGGAGWWWGYEDGGGKSEVNLGGTWTNFENVSLTNEDTGESLIDNYLEVRLTTGGDQYALSGIGFNYFPDPGKEWWKGSNPSQQYQNVSNQTGYCMTYTLEAPEGTFDMELAWDDDYYSYDVFYQKITESSTIKAINLPFSGFDKDAWADDSNTKPAGSHPLLGDRTAALENARGIKLRLRNDGNEGTKVATLRVYQFGWNGECDTNVGQGTPVVAKAAPVKAQFSISNRTVSMLASKAATVQVINLQGAVVHTQTMEPGSTMSLSNLPTGIYMLRAPSLNYTNRILLK